MNDMTNRKLLLAMLLGLLLTVAALPVRGVGCDTKCRNTDAFIWASKTTGIRCVIYKFVDCRGCQGSTCLVTRSGGSGTCGQATSTDQYQQTIDSSKCSNECTLGVPPPDQYSDATIIGSKPLLGWVADGKQQLCYSP